MGSTDSVAISPGSTVLVTGVNGYIGSHIADQYLHRGYRVRGAVRDVNKNSWLIKTFENRHGAGRFELVSVVDMTAEGAFDQAVKGVSAIAHTASVVSLDPDPNNVIPVAIAGALNALKAAYAESSVKRFVLTSSSTAASQPTVESAGVVVTEQSWNEAGIEAAWAEPPYTEARAGDVYGASKAQTEREVWKFHAENRHKRPDLVVNAVLPDVTFGKVLDPGSQGFPSSAGLVAALWNNHLLPVHRHWIPQYFVDVEDVGLLHVAATIFPYVKGQRIFGFGGPFNWDMILGIMRRQDPSREVPADFSNGVDEKAVQPRGKAEQLLRELGRQGFTSLEESIARTLGFDFVS